MAEKREIMKEEIREGSKKGKGEDKGKGRKKK